MSLDLLGWVHRRRPCSLRHLAAAMCVASLACGGSLATEQDSGPTVMSCTNGSTCFEATGYGVLGLDACKASDAGITTQACPTGHVGCCAQGGVLGGLKQCSYSPVTIDAAASECASVEGGVFIPN